MKKLVLIFVLVNFAGKLCAQIGIGTLTPDVNVALDVNGKIKISGAGQAPKQGKILTSDANGIASWEGAVAFAADGAPAENLGISGGSVTKILFSSENYDLGNNFSASVFTAPAHAIYQFNSIVSWIAPSVSFNVFATLRLIRNGVETTIGQHAVLIESQRITSNVIQLDYELQPGDQVYLRVLPSGSDPKSVSAENGLCRFSGKMIIKLN